MDKAGKTAASERQSKSGQSVKPARRAILVEIENVAVRGRQIFYDALKKTLGDKGIELDMATYARCCLGGSVTKFLPRLLKTTSKTRFSEEKLQSEIAAASKTALTSRSLKIDPSFKALVQLAVERHIPIGGLSTLNREAALKLMADLGLSGMDNRVISCSEEDGNCARANAWLNLAMNMSVPPKCCVAVVTSGASCKAALAVKMKILAIPDKFTAVHDFGGADIVADALDKAAVENVFDLLEE